MSEQRLFSVGRFAKLSHTTRDTLHHYDDVGVLPAAARGKNNYRYYSAAQMSTVNVVRVFQELGMSLDEIIEVKQKRNPDFMDGLLSEQIANVDGRIEEWVRARKLLLTLRDIIHSAKAVDETAVTIQYMPSEAIILGGLNDYSKKRDEWNALSDFYKDMESRYPNLDMNYPVWAVFSAERMKRRDWVWPDRYYFYNPEGHDKKNAALYAIGYARGGYGDTGELYERMIDYIDGNGFEICGDTFEEYPLNEMSISDNKNYLIRVMMTVREKRTPANQRNV